MHGTWTGDSFHIWYYTCFNAILPNHPTLALSHRVQKSVLYMCLFCCLAYRVIATIFRNSLKTSSWIFSLAYMNLATSFFASTCLSPYFRVVVHPEISILSQVQISLISTCQVFFRLVVCVEVIVFSALIISKWIKKSFLQRGNLTHPTYCSYDSE